MGPGRAVKLTPVSPAVVRSARPLPLRWELAAVFLAAWGLALWLMAQGIPWGDSPELYLSAAKLANAHTTGYGLWLMLVHAFGALPVVMVSQGLVGPFLHGVAALLCAATALALGVKRPHALLMGVGGALVVTWLASARALEVYGLAVVLMLFMGWWWCRPRLGVGQWAAGAGLIWILGVMHHGLGLIGGSLWLLGVGLLPAGRQRFFKSLPALLMLGALGTTVWLYHPLRSAAALPGAWDWCAPRTPQGMACLLSGEGFRSFGGSTSQMVANLATGAGAFWPVLLVWTGGALAGLRLKGLPRQRLVISLLLLGLGLGLSAAYMTREKAAFSAVWLAVLVLPAAQGVLTLGPRWGGVAAGLMALVPALWLGLSWPGLAKDQGGEELAFHVLSGLREDAVLLLDWDEDPQLHYLLWQEAAQGDDRLMAPNVDAKGRFLGAQGVGLPRPVQVVYTYLLPFEWYRDQVNARARQLWGRPLLARRFFEGDLPDKGLLTRLIFRDFAEEQPVYVNKFDDRLYLQTGPGVYAYVPGPLVFQVTPVAQAREAHRTFEIDPLAFNQDPSLQAALSRFLTYRGTVRYLEKLTRMAYYDFDAALQADPDRYAAHWYLGQLYNRECFQGEAQTQGELAQCRARVDCASLTKADCAAKKRSECRVGSLSECVVVSDAKMVQINKKSPYGMSTWHYQQALSALRKKVAEEPDNPLHHLFLANLYNQLGNDALGKEHENKAKALTGGRL